MVTRRWKVFEDMFTRFNRIHERDRQTDRRMDNARRHRPRLCIASRGKNKRGFRQAKSSRFLHTVSHGSTTFWGVSIPRALAKACKIDLFTCWRRPITCSGKKYTYNDRLINSRIWSGGVIFNDREWSLAQISMTRHYSTLNRPILETVKNQRRSNLNYSSV